MRNELYIKSYYADAAIGRYLIVKAGSADTNIAQADGPTAKISGVADSLGADGAGEPTDVIHNGIATVVYGGNVTRGDLLTSDANGKAVTATVAGSRIIGVAMVSGVANDEGSVLIQLGTLAVAA